MPSAVVESSFLLLGSNGPRATLPRGQPLMRQGCDNWCCTATVILLRCFTPRLPLGSRGIFLHSCQQHCGWLTTSPMRSRRHRHVLTASEMDCYRVRNADRLLGCSGIGVSEPQRQIRTAEEMDELRRLRRMTSLGGDRRAGR